MRKTLVIFNLLALALVSGSAFAQEKKVSTEEARPESRRGAMDLDPEDARSRRNALALEILGRGGLYSLNYDYSITPDLAVGAGAAIYSSGSASVKIFPIFANYYFGGPNHRFMVTGGPTIVTASASVDTSTINGSGLAGTVGAGYEYRGDAGFLFRAAPYVNLGAMSGVWFGLSGGLTF